MAIGVLQNFPGLMAALWPVMGRLASAPGEGVPILVDGDASFDGDRWRRLAAKALEAPAPSLDGMRRLQEDKLRAAGAAVAGEDVATLARIVRLCSFEKDVTALEARIERPDAKLLARELRRRLVAAASGDRESLDGWNADYAKLSAYAQAEKKMNLVLNWARARYPENGRYALELDFSPDNARVGRGEVSALEPDLAYYRGLELVQTYRALKDSGDEGDAAVADAAWEAISNHATLSHNALGAFVFLQGRGYDATPTWEALEHMTSLMEATYGDPKLRTFLERVEERERENLQNNEGYRARMELAKSIAALEVLDAPLAALRRPFEEVEDRLDAAMLDDMRAMLEARVASYRDFLRGEEARLESTANAASGMPDEAYAGTGQVPPPAETTPESESVREELQRAERLLERFRFRPMPLREDFEDLRAIAEEAAAMEDAHAQALLNRLASFVPSEGDGSLRCLPLDHKGRAAAYRDEEMALRTRMVLSLVDARIAQYESFEDEASLARGIVGAIAAPIELLQGPPPESAFPEPPPPEVTNEGMIASYRDIRERLASDDPETRRLGLEAYQQLEAMSGHKSLYEAYKGHALFVNMTAGVGIVIAAAATGGLAATLAAPFLEGVAGGAALLTAINGTVFTLTHKALDAVLRGENVVDRVFDASTLLECGLNSLMFGWMGRAMGRFDKYFEKGLEAVARRNVAKTLGRAVGEGDLSLVSAEAAALRGGAGVQAAKSAAGFVYEAAKFQQWGFYVDVGRRALGGDASPIENALRGAVSGESIFHNAAFLAGLKAAHVVAMPLLAPVYDHAHAWAIGRQVEGALKTIDADIALWQGKLDAYFESRQGDLTAIVRALERRLGERERIIDRVPSEYQNDHFRAVREFHREVRKDLETLRTQAEGMGEILGPNNPYGAKATQDGLTYDASKKEGFRAALNRLAGGRNVKVLGDVLEVRFRFPGGVEETLLFAPSVPSARALPAAPRGTPKVPNDRNARQQGDPYATADR